MFVNKISSLESENKISFSAKQVNITKLENDAKKIVDVFEKTTETIKEPPKKLTLFEKIGSVFEGGDNGDPMSWENIQYP